MSPVARSPGARVSPAGWQAALPERHRPRVGQHRSPKCHHRLDAPRKRPRSPPSPSTAHPSKARLPARQTAKGDSDRFEAGRSPIGGLGGRLRSKRGISLLLTILDAGQSQHTQLNQRGFREKGLPPQAAGCHWWLVARSSRKRAKPARTPEFSLDRLRISSHITQTAILSGRPYPETPTRPTARRSEPTGPHNGVIPDQRQPDLGEQALLARLNRVFRGVYPRAGRARVRDAGRGLGRRQYSPVVTRPVPVQDWAPTCRKPAVPVSCEWYQTWDERRTTPEFIPTSDSWPGSQPLGVRNQPVKGCSRLPVNVQSSPFVSEIRFLHRFFGTLSRSASFATLKTERLRSRPIGTKT